MALRTASSIIQLFSNTYWSADLGWSIVRSGAVEVGFAVVWGGGERQTPMGLRRYDEDTRDCVIEALKCHH